MWLGGSNSLGSEYYLNVWVADTGEYISGIEAYPTLRIAYPVTYTSLR